MHILSNFFTLAPRYPRPPVDTRLEGSRVALRMAGPDDWRGWRSMRELSRDFLVPWEPEWPPDALAHSFYSGLLRRQQREWRRGRSYAFMVFLRDAALVRNDAMLAGGVTLSDVRRGIAQKATLGYWIGRPYARQRLMTEAVTLAVDFAFQILNLHRMEASCLPDNEPSRRLLHRLGFAEEGYAKSYLRVNGRWQDHVLWGKVA